MNGPNPGDVFGGQIGGVVVYLAKVLMMPRNRSSVGCRTPQLLVVGISAASRPCLGGRPGEQSNADRRLEGIQGVLSARLAAATGIEITQRANPRTPLNVDLSREALLQVLVTPVPHRASRDARREIHGGKGTMVIHERNFGLPGRGA